MRNKIVFSSLSSAGVLALVALAFPGCNERTKVPNVHQVDNSDTPQGLLKNVMRRLQFALDHAKPSPDSGVTSVRKSDYQLIEPQEEGGEYTAEVTITTTVTVTAKPPKQKAPTANADPQLHPISSEPPASETTTYKLAYRNHRWELVAPVQTELPKTEDICLQHALSDG